MASSGASLGDRALVSNNTTGQQTSARVEDVGPSGGTGEISKAAATALGIQYSDNRFTIGTPRVTVQAYARTLGIASDCHPYVTN
jgi:hypothetical protein